MKMTLLIISYITIIFCSCNSNPDKVYICTGPYSTAYHKTRHCTGLNNCSMEIKKIQKNKAISMGRHKCGYCY